MIKRKKKYRILVHTHGIYKNGTDEPICKAERDTHREEMYRYQGGIRGWDELGGWV